MLVLMPAAGGNEQTCDIRGTPEPAPNICGVASQGGMLYGQVDAWDVYYGDTKISNNGIFVVGMDGDAPDTIKLKFCMQGTKLAAKVCKEFSYPIAQRKYIEQHVTVADNMVHYPADVEKRIDAEAARIKKARSATLTDTATYFLNLSMPENMKKYKNSGVYWSRRVFNGIPKSPHKGLDFAAPAGTAVYPIADGKVILAEEHYMNGNIVMVSHGHGIVSAYLHLSKIDAKVGDLVNGNTILGKVGSTGRSSGAHLHLGLYWNNVAIDPALFIMKTKVAG